MNILLACSAGMSTSMLVTKMEEAAKARGMEGKIWAVASDVVPENISEADVLLIGPQVRFMLSQMKKIGDEKGVPVAVIDSMSYGTMNGKAVLEQAIELVNQK
ncbi:PTS sugar transporter subunit IIB [Paenibacillus pinistramenti]|uniref:PTS sugar transporter subunit IIB n=1 Tax=Paenibacillus pinistramenti TaxID=1768003 RepID=UPI00110813B1|nr:PTS sugar transporter subunit IIB [Paenibacillus pinistramenti]